MLYIILILVTSKFMVSADKDSIRSHSMKNNNDRSLGQGPLKIFGDRDSRPLRKMIPGITELFQELTESIQKELKRKEPESMDDVSGTIIGTMVERCDFEETKEETSDERDCPSLARSFVAGNRQFFSQLDGISNVMGNGSLSEIIEMMVQLNWGNSLVFQALDLNMILRLIENYAGDVPLLLEVLVELLDYTEEVITTMYRINQMAPELTSSNRLLIGTLVVSIQALKFWFVRESEDDFVDEDDDREGRYVRRPDESIISSIEIFDHEANDVRGVLQNAIFGYLSSKGDIKAAVSFSTLSYASIYGKFGKKFA